ncbi:MAG: glycine--tRNA ligase subunit beta [Proteobacteria bacterium]|nr:glycine--tRNA ligase subunit beta [Pseudomonadota bacterium]MBU4287498.1 glycine--tRNA ligase subunit beta [Pseudomonadota bacterium]MBU4414924.1 glycine--tRNA ligase subunit beta [Pseudomonadota bacterium]
MDSLLLEIGTEEIPAGYIEPALKAFSRMLLQKLDDGRIEHGNANTFGTPRRLVLEVKNVSDRQKPLTTEITGPPASVGFDKKGKPTIAAEKFAKKAGVSVKDLKIKEMKKGDYLCAKKIEHELKTGLLLKSILPDVITAIPFPKTMRWADLSVEFARPIHTILALLGDKIIPFMVGNIKSSRYSLGHSFMRPGRIKISSPDEYIKALDSAYVLVDSKKRREIIERETAKAAESLNGRVLQDDELVDIVTNLVEYPVVVSGNFDTKFLELPDEVLITAMREHQKYFSVVDNKGNLMSCFITVNNTRAKDMSLVAKGHERVLRARLEDAQFFYRSDLNSSFEDRIEKLKGVLFQASLGSMYEKVIRVKMIAEYLADKISHDSDLDQYMPVLKKHTAKAALMCKADLVSQVVVEFPKLQGVMGRIYALNAGEPDDVAYAIEEHYRPSYSGGPLTETLIGSILSIADKIDSICGCFVAGLIPTGASDPYAFRRQGIGIVQIMLSKSFSFSLIEMIEKSMKLFSQKTDQEFKKNVDDVYSFLKNRIAYLLAEEGFSKDIISATISVTADHVPNIWNRARALENLKTKPDFEPLSIAFKRVVNIIKKAEIPKSKDVDENLFQDKCETALYEAYKKVNKKVLDDLDKGLFDQALYDIASLRNVVDDFFDGVMVMAEDKKIRENRLALLINIADMFGMFADFSKISTPTHN